MTQQLSHNTVNRSGRLVAGAAVFAAVSGIAGLLAMLSSPEMVVRSALQHGPIAPVESNAAPHALAEIDDTAKLWRTATSPRDAAPLAPQALPQGLSVGDRLAMESPDGRKRTLMVVSVRPTTLGAATNVADGSASTQPARFLLVTCQAIDSKGAIIQGRPVRFMIENDAAPTHSPVTPAAAPARAL